MPKREIATTIAVEGEKAFKSALADAAREMRVLGSEMKAASAEFELNGNKQEFLATKSQILSRELDQQKTIVKGLEAAMQSATTKFGQSSKEADGYAIQLNNARAKAAGLQKELNQTEKELEKVDDGMEDATKESRSFARAMENNVEEAAEDSEKALKGLGQELLDIRDALDNIRGMEGVQLGMDIADGLSDLMQEAYQFVNDTREARRNRILTGYAAEDAGLPAEFVQQEVNRVAALTGDGEQAREGVGSLIRIEGINQELLSAINDNLVGLDLKAPEMDYAQIAEGFLETVGTQQLSGAMLEALEKSGYAQPDIDRVNAALEKATSGEDAAQIILTELAGGHYADFLRRYQTDNQQLIDAEASKQRVEQATQNIAQSAEPLVTDINNTVADILDATSSELDKISNEGFGKFAGDVARENLGNMWDAVNDTAERAATLWNRWVEMFGQKEAVSPQDQFVWELDNSRVGSGVHNNKGGGGVHGGGGAHFEIIDNMATELQEIEDEATKSGEAIPANFAAGIEAATPEAVASAQSMVDQLEGILNTVTIPTLGNLAQMIGGNINVSVQPSENVINLDGRTVGRMITPYVSSEQGRQAQRGGIG